MRIKVFLLALVLPFVMGFGQGSGQQEVGGLSRLHGRSAVVDTNVVLPPAWAFGILYGAYTNQEQTIELINNIIDHDYPIDAFWIDSWIWDWRNEGQGPDKYMDFVADTVSYPDMEAMWSFMEEKNIKAGMWMWDCILQTGNEEVYEDFRAKGFFSKEYIRTDTWHNGGKTTVIGDEGQSVEGTWCGNIDFENPEAVACFREKVKPFFDKGLDFIKLDKTDAIPACKAFFELSQDLGKETRGRGFMLSHSHGVEREEYKRYPAKWTDDTRSDWSAKAHTREFSPWLPKVGFKENIAKYTNLEKHFYKIPFLANDMGGFAVSKDGYVDEELYIRWLQFAVFVPLSTPFAQPENPSRNIAFLVSERADTIFRNYAHLKMELFPYIYTYAHRSRLEGVNTIRPIPGHLYQYLFGEEILVAPVYEQGRVAREVFLPPGSAWIDYWEGTTLDGGQSVTVEAPVGRIPLFVKQGAIIPKRKYARSIETGANDVLELHIYPGADGVFTLIEDDGISNDYLEGGYATTRLLHRHASEGLVIAAEPVEGFYAGMGGEREWQVVIHQENIPDKITIDGKPLDFTIQGRQVKVQAFTRNTHRTWKLRLLD